MVSASCEVRKDESLETDVFILRKDGDACNGEIHVDERILDLKNTNFRYRVLFFSCFITIGTYFCYDTPGALQEQIIHDLEISTAEFSLLYSLYSWPNVILCLINGYLLDQVFGLRLGTIIFSSITLSGQLIVAIGCFTKQFWLMQVGRFVFGVGGESMSLCDSSYAVKWFKGKKLAMALGLQLSIAKLGSTINFMSMVPIYNKFSSTSSYHQRHISLGYCMLIAGTSCVLTLICAIVLWFLEGIAAKKNGMPPTSRTNGKRIRILDIRFFPLNYWLTVATGLAYYISLLPFFGLCSAFIQKKFDFSSADASTALGLVFFITIIGTPISGLIVDRFHCNVIGIFIGLLFHLTANLMITFTFWSPWIAVAVMGIGFSIVSPTLWSFIALQVSENLVGTAYGIIISVVNIGLALFTYLGGQVVDHFGYFILELGLITLACLSICLTIILGVLKNKAQRNKIWNHIENVSNEDQGL